MNKIKTQRGIANRFVRMPHLRVFKGCDDMVAGNSSWQRNGTQQAQDGC